MKLKKIGIKKKSFFTTCVEKGRKMIEPGKEGRVSVSYKIDARLYCLRCAILCVGSVAPEWKNMYLTGKEKDDIILLNN